MRKWILTTLICLLPLIVYGQEVKEGFKGYDWGTSFERMNICLTLTETPGKAVEANVKMYFADSLLVPTIGRGIKVALCIFGFYKDEFAHVSIVIDGYYESAEILSGLRETYGKPDSAQVTDNYNIDPYGESKGRYPLIWAYNWVSRETYIYYEYDPYDKRALFEMASILHTNRIKEQWEKEKEKEDAEKAKDDF